MSVKNLSPLESAVSTIEKQVAAHKKGARDLQKASDAIKLVESSDPDKKVNPSQVKEAEEAKPAGKGGKSWYYVHNPSESDRYPLVKYNPTELALKKLNIL